MCLQPRRPTVSGVASKAAWPAGRGRGFCHSTALWWDPTWSPVSSSGALSTGKSWTCWSGSRGGPQKWSEGWSTSPMRKGWESWGCSAWKRRLWGDLIAAFQYLKGPYRKDGDRLFGRACWDRTGSNGFKLEEGGFKLDTGKNVWQWGWWNTGTGWPERCYTLHPCTHSRPGWTGLWAT